MCEFVALFGPIDFYAVPPKVLHYGLDWKIGKTGYEFDKHWFYDFDALMCPPWNLTDRSKGGLFQHPPHPDLYPTKVLICLERGSCSWLVDLRSPHAPCRTAISHMHQHACKASDAGQLLIQCAWGQNSHACEYNSKIMTR